MNIKVLHNILICCSLIVLSGCTLRDNNQKVDEHPFSDKVIIDCARYVIGAEKPLQTDRYYLEEYLIYLNAGYSDSKKITEYLLTDSRMISSNKIESFINLLRLERNYGVTLCAIQSDAQLKHIKEKLKDI